MAHMENDILVDTWCVDDVAEVRPDLTYAQAVEVLELVADTRDCNYGINWDVLTMAAEQLFPEEE